ncbi:MAG: glycerophosphodiester phosphodiesterase family protein [Bacteroidota bacterium]
MIRQFLVNPIILGIFSVLSFWACKSKFDGNLTPPPGFDWQGHRGCRGLMPENSIPAFLKAISIPEVTTLELDFAVSKDSQLVVSHEPWFNPAICRLPNGQEIPSGDKEKYLIYQSTVAEIRAFDCGSWGNTRFPEQQKQKTYKPTFREVVAAVRNADSTRAKNIQWNVEIKSEPEWDGIRTPPVEEFARIVIAELRALGLEKTAIVQSFDTRALEAMHRQAPEFRLAYLIENISGLDANLKKLSFTPQIYSPNSMLVSKKMVNKCHDLGIKVIPWTVNERSSMQDMINAGVDGLITDYPNLIANSNVK